VKSRAFGSLDKPTEKWMRLPWATAEFRMRLSSHKVVICRGFNKLNQLSIWRQARNRKTPSFDIF
jgi:hypothetical protein